jgi:hypothetical protein
MAAKSRSAKFYASHPLARKKKLAYQSDYNKKPDQVKKRVELNAYNKKHKSGPNDDASHKGNKIVGFLAASKNRGSKTNAPGDSRARGIGHKHPKKKK